MKITMMPQHEDYCTLLKNFEDEDILTRPLFDVNMRLFKSSPGYHKIVIDVCNYIHWCARTEKEGYKKPHGYSGANAGIPFNIIALADGTVMINPRIVEVIDNNRREGYSNCGSLMLEEPIKIWRWAKVKVEYFNLAGQPTSMEGYLPTVQHEIDHNRGILITGRRA